MQGSPSGQEKKNTCHHDSVLEVLPNVIRPKSKMKNINIGKEEAKG